MNETTSGKFTRTCLTFVLSFFMSIGTMIPDNEMPVLTPNEFPAVDNPGVGDNNDDNGAVAETLSMGVDEIDVVIDKAGAIPVDDGGDEAGDGSPYISDVINESGMGRPNQTWMLHPRGRRSLRRRCVMMNTVVSRI